MTKIKQFNYQTEKRSSGVTLLECMIVIGIMAILSAVIAPNFLSYRSNMQLNAACREIYSMFQMAKITAIKKNCYCTVSFGETVDSVTYDYLLYQDVNENWEYNTGDEILMQGDWDDFPSVVLDTNKGGGDGLTFDNGATIPTLTFRPNGLTKKTTDDPDDPDLALGEHPDDLAGGELYLTLEKQEGEKKRYRKVVVEPGGKISIEKY